MPDPGLAEAEDQGSQQAGKSAEQQELNGSSSSPPEFDGERGEGRGGGIQKRKRKG